MSLQSLHMNRKAQKRVSLTVLGSDDPKGVHSQQQSGDGRVQILSQVAFGIVRASDVSKAECI